MTAYNLGLGGSLTPLGLPGGSFADAPGGAILSDGLADSVGVASTATYSYAFTRTLTEALSLTGEAIGLYVRLALVTDDIGVSYRIAAVRVQPASTSDVININAGLSTIRGILLFERIGLGFAQVVNQHANVFTADALELSSDLDIAIGAVLSEGVGVQLTQTVQQAVQVIDELGLTAVISPTLKYGQTLSDTIRLADSLARFFGASVGDGIGIAPSQVITTARAGVISEGIGIAPAVVPQLIMHVTVADEVGLEAANLLNAIYTGVIDEGIEIVAGYVAPDGSFTTWAMNTRTGAVTEYDNYEFNSFARLGDKYIGASQSGLYELLGDNDAGTNIVATIKSGFAQWANTRLASFKGAYLAVRGEGNFVLRVITGDGTTYNYAVNAQNMKSTKIRMGKGLRARYFAFELVSTGQDFDLDTLEFVPLVADRRV